MVDLDCLMGGERENRQAEMFVLRILRYSADGTVGQLQDGPRVLAYLLFEGICSARQHS